MSLGVEMEFGLKATPSGPWPGQAILRTCPSAFTREPVKA